MATASILARDPRSGASRLAGFLSANPLWVGVAIVAVAVIVRAFGTVGADVSVQLWIAHQLNGGVRLYRDIIEVNPPLWFWMGMPVDWLAGLVHVRPDHLLILVIGALAALSLAATNRLLASIAAPRRTLLLAYAGLVLVIMPWVQFGQREQIALIGTLPYAALIAARRTGREVSPAFALIVGVCAALGFALKHYFLLVPILLELWLLVGMRKAWRPIRPETLAMAAIGALYAAAFPIRASDYFTVTLPVIMLAYGSTGAQRLIDLFQPAVLTALATLALLFANPRLLRSDHTGFASALAVAAIGFAGSYFIQAKGWSYHAVPLAGCATIALAAILSGDSKPRFLMLAAPALLALPLWIGSQQAGDDPQSEAEARRAVEGLHAGDSVGFVAVDPALGRNIALQEGFGYPSRYSGFWMMRAVVRNQRAGGPDPRLTRFGRLVVQQTVQDFRCMPPRRIVVARPTAAAARDGAFDILAFFLRDPQFAEMMRHYRPIGRTSVETFELESQLTPGYDCIRRARD